LICLVCPIFPATQLNFLFLSNAILKRFAPLLFYSGTMYRLLNKSGVVRLELAVD